MGLSKYIVIASAIIVVVIIKIITHKNNKKELEDFNNHIKEVENKNE